MKINVIGIDPSLRNFGFARGVYDSETGDVEITGIALSETHAATKEDKKNSRQNELDLADAVIHQNTMIHQCVGNEIAFAEVPVGSQSSRAMLSVGVCIGILSSCPIPMIAVTPTQVKKAGTGVGTASKDEMIASAHMLHPDAPWLTIKRKGAMELLGKNEHMADAIFAIYAGIRTAEFKQVLAAMKELRG
jgi:Holliday junction resolvasome RuvABC endonuclease subunit